MSSKTKGILFILSAAFCFALMGAFVKLAGDLPSIQKSFFRNAVAAVFALVILVRTPHGFRFQKSNLPFLLLRSICGTIGILCNFYAVDHLVLSDASMLNKLSPFFAILFSYLCLKEKVTPFQVTAVCIAFAGSLFIIKPGFSGITDSLPALVGVLGAVGAGSAYTAVRYLSQHGEKGPFIVFFFSAFSCLVTLPFLLFDYHPMSVSQLVCLLLAGLAAAGGQFSITAAYSHAPASEISVFDYTQVLFSALLGLLLFEQWPDGFSVAGYIIICGVSVVMFRYNQKKL